MSTIQKILCPIDLSSNSLAAVELATKLAKDYDAKLVFLYVAPQWLPEESMMGSEYLLESIEEEKKQFMEVRPSEEGIEFEHEFVHGNPGPEIVNASEACDMIVMTTHGRTGLMRFLMGSVAQYVMRYAQCPIMTVKIAEIEPMNPSTQEKKLFATDVMHIVCPIHAYDKMEDVIRELTQANESGAPVVDGMGACIGILTESDIDRYRELKRRFDARDETVLDEMFETDEFGLRRPTNHDFDQVHRHMTSPVVTISNQDSCDKAREAFETNPKIHHLVVVDQNDKPLGVIEAGDVKKCDGISSSA